MMIKRIVLITFLMFLPSALIAEEDLSQYEKDKETIFKYRNGKLCKNFASYVFTNQESRSELSSQAIKEKDLVNHKNCRKDFNAVMADYIDSGKQGTIKSYFQALGIFPYKQIRVGKSDPDDNFEAVGSLSVTSGSGCGLLGKRGTYNNAVAHMQLYAGDLDADYIQIYTVQEPYFRNEKCFANAYSMTGQAFKKVSDHGSNQTIFLETAESKEKTNIEKLREIKKLLDEGILTEEEYQTQKAKLLDEGL